MSRPPSPPLGQMPAVRGLRAQVRRPPSEERSRWRSRVRHFSSPVGGNGRKRVPHRQIARWSAFPYRKALQRLLPLCWFELIAVLTLRTEHESVRLHLRDSNAVQLPVAKTGLTAGLV